MANKRMFSLSVVDTDNFLEMPISSRLLYYELGMRADDDGFVDNWKKILLFTGLKEDDLKVLISKQFIIPFESGIIVIRHWRMNNYLQKDRTKPTIHQEELKKLEIDDNNVYKMYTSCIHSIEENRIDKNSIEENSIIYIVEQILDYLNLKTSKHFKKSSIKTQKLIKARLNEGYKLEDFKRVIDIKTKEWLNDDKMNTYLRPETLFSNKFEGYLNQKEKDLTIKDVFNDRDWSVY